MEIAVLTASELIENEAYFLQQKDLTQAEFQKNGNKLAQTALDLVKNNYQKNGLAMFQYQIVDLSELKISFFSNIINLPYSYAKKYAEFFADGATAEIKFYFSVESPFVNKSKLWIEEIGDLAENVVKIEELLVQTQENESEKDSLVDEKNSKK
ncbi:hypothetical protein [Xylocopilactobacillus apicola]|uniref:Uncharacterized protein n=1 Tax=Xylocopilactobacillus apicola TaxID=2932184 RepID=A0AAU9DW06_9LACO|nr:hypothetical protein [Xylocopilactobacillus apicola]BDR58113.1 hypothetical protein XA3_05540 [Xylocopilactobacillus apicola]